MKIQSTRRLDYLADDDDDDDDVIYDHHTILLNILKTRKRSGYSL